MVTEKPPSVEGIQGVTAKESWEVSPTTSFTKRCLETAQPRKNQVLEGKLMLNRDIL